MKAVLSISFSLWLLILGLMPGMDPHDIAKLPNLFTHYSDHQKHPGEDTSFWDFLAEHCTPHSDSEGEENHENLPFHNHCCSVTFFVVSDTFILTNAQVLSIPLKQTFYKQVYHSDYYSSIFLPPKI